MTLELSKKSIPPQIAVLVVIARHDNITLKQLFEIVKHQERSSILSYSAIDELSKDLNVLLLLGLVRENYGKYSITEKGKMIVEKVLKNYNNSIR
uniref:ArnR1-like winged helix-turn-helix domain-containing protein n=1 Tax=Ignisphaera aggregans TaxID=334771 RepID=A0A7C4FH78_9CREN